MSNDPETYETSTALVAQPSSLPSIAQMRETMMLQKERRALLVEYVKSCMDPKLHFYNPKELGMGEDRLRLNQDGARNLCGLYEVYAGEPVVKEALEEDGHLTVDVRLPLVSHNTGQSVAWGIGLCSTRESKYAYRWVGEKNVPSGLDKRSLKTRTGKYGTMYRIPNEDLADQYHTVRMMARKRAEVAAVMELPAVTEIFAPAEEDEEDAKKAREGALRLLRKQVSAIPSQHRDGVLGALCGIKQSDIAGCDTETLERYVQVFADFEAAGINWKSDTLLDDISRMIDARGKKASKELFG